MITTKEEHDICYYCEFKDDCKIEPRSYRGTVCIFYIQSEEYSPEW